MQSKEISNLLNFPINKYHKNGERTRKIEWIDVNGPMVENYMDRLIDRAQKHVDKGEFAKLRQMRNKGLISEEVILNLDEAKREKYVLSLSTTEIWNKARMHTKYLEIAMPELERLVNEKDFQKANEIYEVSMNVFLSSRAIFNHILKNIRRVIKPEEVNHKFAFRDIWSAIKIAGLDSNKEMLQYIQNEVDEHNKHSANKDLDSAEKHLQRAQWAIIVLEARTRDKILFNPGFFESRLKSILYKYEKEKYPFSGIEIGELDMLVSLEICRRNNINKTLKKDVPKESIKIISKLLKDYESGEFVFIEGNGNKIFLPNADYLNSLPKEKKAIKKNLAVMNLDLTFAVSDRMKELKLL